MSSNILTELQKLKVVDLQKALKERGLTFTGLKADLVERLHGALMREQMAGAATASPAVAAIAEAASAPAGPPAPASAAPAPTLPLQAASPAAVATGPIASAAPARIAPSQTPVVLPNAAPTVAAATSSARILLEGGASQTIDLASVTPPVLTSENDGVAELSPTASDANSAVKISGKSLTKEERAKRFGNVGVSDASGNSVDDKKASRAQRFGLSSQPTASADEVAVPKLKKRAERFGEVLATKLKAEQAEEQATVQVSTVQSALLRRAERFGLPATGGGDAGAAPESRKRTGGVGAADAASAEQLAKRASRFGAAALNGGASSDPVDEERRLARASRFGPAVPSLPENGK